MDLIGLSEGQSLGSVLATEEAYAVGRAGADHPVLHGGAEHRPDVYVPRLDRAGGEPGGVYLLYPGFDL